MITHRIMQVGRDIRRCLVHVLLTTGSAPRTCVIWIWETEEINSKETQFSYVKLPKENSVFKRLGTRQRIFNFDCIMPMKVTNTARSCDPSLKLILLWKPQQIPTSNQLENRHIFLFQITKRSPLGSLFALGEKNSNLSPSVQKLQVSFFSTSGSELRFPAAAWMESAILIVFCSVSGKDQTIFLLFSKCFEQH